MNADPEVQVATALQLQNCLNQIYGLGNALTDLRLEALDYVVSDIWSAFGFRMAACRRCRELTPEVLMDRQQGRSYCPECVRTKTGYSTTRNRQRRHTVKYCRRRQKVASYTPRTTRSSR